MQWIRTNQDKFFGTTVVQSSETKSGQDAVSDRAGSASGKPEAKQDVLTNILAFLSQALSAAHSMRAFMVENRTAYRRLVAHNNTRVHDWGFGWLSVAVQCGAFSRNTASVTAGQHPTKKRFNRQPVGPSSIDLKDWRFQHAKIVNWVWGESVMRELPVASISLLSAFLIVGPAVAADLKVPKRAPAAAPARTQQQQQPARSNWSGGQIGSSSGTSSVNNNVVEPGAFNYSSCSGPCFETPFAFNGHPRSFIFGGFFGYRIQMGDMVVGAEADINGKRGQTSKFQNTPPPWLCCELFNGSQKQGADGSLRGRFGYLITPSVLLYATAGLAVGNIKGSFSYTAVGFYTVTGAATWSDTRTGGTVGGGVETQIVDRLKARIEYRYTDFGTFSKNVPLTNNSFGACGPTVCGTNAHIDLRASNHRAMVGLGLDL